MADDPSRPLVPHDHRDAEFFADVLRPENPVDIYRRRTTKVCVSCQQVRRMIDYQKDPIRHDGRGTVCTICNPPVRRTKYRAVRRAGKGTP